MSTWTPEMEEQLRALYADGLSASQIARKFGEFSRNAVISKLHRMGLTGVPRRTLGCKNNLSALKRWFAPAAFVVPLVEPPPVAVEPLRVRMVDITERQCKWPLWPDAGRAWPKFECCGLPVHGEAPYCEVHTRLAFTPAKARAA